MYYIITFEVILYHCMRFVEIITIYILNFIYFRKFYNDRFLNNKKLQFTIIYKMNDSTFRHFDKIISLNTFKYIY